MIPLNFKKSSDGLLPAIVQEAETGRILMLAYVNQEAFDKTLETGRAHYWSRSRKSLWLKGETSGNVQLIKDILVDCDEDTIVYVVTQQGGAACHKGYHSCFYRKVEDGQLRVIDQRVFDPETVYTKETAADSAPTK
ncbi:MAG: phosphoribosyl-AMP cyclohydrolase [Desulfofustis sp.]|nr:phosphoribosyl-AMP cyclohydrolase [Desulfofustis sp.]